MKITLSDDRGGFAVTPPAGDKLENQPHWFASFVNALFYSMALAKGTGWRVKMETREGKPSHRAALVMATRAALESKTRADCLSDCAIMAMARLHGTLPAEPKTAGETMQ